MADYISREAAIETIKGYGKEAISAGRKSLDPVDDTVGMAYVINVMPAADVEPVQRWIPCSERLPESYDEVLIWDSYDNAHYLGYYANANGWVVDGYEDDRYHFDITHWQPLPEPPVEGGAGNAAD